MENPTSVFIANRRLLCPHCENDLFFEDRCLIQRAELAVFKLSYTTYACSVCGRVEWFTRPPTEVLFSAPEGDIDCLECGELIPHGSTDCPKCGWSYAGK